MGSDAPELSFVIPTLDEERMLPRALAQFAGLDVPHEVIVGDGGSRDRTRDVAARFGASVAVNPGPQTIGSNRNTGAAAARAPVLVFCDADTVFEDLPRFARRVVEAFRDPAVAGGMPRIGVFPDERIGTDRVFHGIYNGAIRLSFRTPMAFGSGQCQIVRASTFRRVGGYPAAQVHGEDSTLFRELRKRGRLVWFDDLTVWESPRRYRHYGYFRYLGLATFSLVGQSLLGRNVLKEWKRVG